MESDFVQLRLLMDILMITILQVSSVLILIGIVGSIADWMIKKSFKKHKSGVNWHKTLKLGFLGIAVVFAVFFIYMFSSLLINFWDILSKLINKTN